MNNSAQRLTLTRLERVGLDAEINLTDGHARIHENASVRHALSNSSRIFDYAAAQTQSSLESEFFDAYGRLNGLTFPRQPLLSYSSSNLAHLVGCLLGVGTRVLWPVPSFDNIRDVVAMAGAQIVTIDEHDLEDVLFSPTSSALYDALWLTLPNNPTGLVFDEHRYRRVARHMSQIGKTLVVDHCFRSHSKTLAAFDQFQLLEESGCQYFVLEDTGKTISTLDVKVGMVMADSAGIEAIRSLNEDILLNVSPFTLALLSEIMRDWKKEAYIDTLRGTIEQNRRQVRDALELLGLSSDMKSEEVPVEWARADSVEHMQELVQSMADVGVSVLPGSNFFAGTAQLSCRHLRVALARDEELIRAGAQRMRRLAGEG